MARIPLTSGFTIIPEGSYIFKIVNAIYDEKFGKLEIKLETNNGLKHTETYRLLDKNGNPNDGALAAFSVLATCALQDNTREDVDPAELIGRFFGATVAHDVQPSRDNPNKTVTFVRLNDKTESDGFPPATPAAPANALSALLGR